MDKTSKKEILKRLKADEAAKFEANLPLSRAEFGRFFGVPEGLLCKHGCDHTDRFALRTLFNMGLADKSERVISWLNEQGGYCDCEIMLNVEPKFDKKF